MFDLIINPTNKCNFRCDFCSAYNITNGEINHHKVFKFIKENINNIETIIINGGDPLMMSIYFYENLIKILNEYDKINRIKISLTTNLYDFYINTNKWVDIFKNKRIGIVTSFQYGNRRKLSDGRVFTEDMFRNIIKLFYNNIGYIPNFIYVIDHFNKKYVNNALLLAKDLNTKCKLNRVLCIGKNKDYFPLYEYFEILSDIIDNGLYLYENNIMELQFLYYNKISSCPYNINCSKTIVTINPDNTIHSCDKLSMYNTINKNVNYHIFKNDCIKCENFIFCNSCKMTIYEAKINNDINFCKRMKEILPKFKNSIKEIRYETNKFISKHN